MNFFVVLYLVTFAYAQSQVVTTTSGPPPVPTPTGGNFSAEYKLYGWHNCDSSKQKAVLDALDEKHKIMGAEPIWYTDFSSAAIVDFLGRPATFLYNSNRPDITKNLRNVYNFGNGWWLSGHELEIFCGSDTMKRPYGALCRDQPGHVHIVDKYDGTNDGLMFCDSWFRLPTLADGIRLGSTSHDPHDLSKYDNRARQWINALLLKKNVGVWPERNGIPQLRRIKHTYPNYGTKWVSTPSAAKTIAKARTKGLEAIKTICNIDNWSWYAMAAFLTTSDGVDMYTARPYIPDGLNFENQHLQATEEDPSAFPEWPVGENPPTITEVSTFPTPDPTNTAG